MFFILSKLLSFLISPFIWSIFIYGWSFVVKAPGKKKWLRTSSFLLLFVFVNPFLFRGVNDHWEPELTSSKRLKGQADVVVVLGGMSGYDASIERIQFYKSADRLFQAVEVYQTGIAKKMVISGGSPNVLITEKPESQYLKDYLINLGLPAKDLYIESESKNTYQNAVYTKELFEREQLKKKIILVTSAFHMYRAKRCFEKAGFTVIPYGADSYRNIEGLTLSDFIIPDPSLINNWQIIFKEWIGLFVYRMKGYV